MPSTNKRNRKLVYGSNTIISSVIFLAILGFVALIAERHPFRVDLTESGSFSLSGQTRNILNQVDKPIEVKVFISAAGPSAQIPLNPNVQASDRVKTPKTIHAMKVDFAAAAEEWDDAAKFLRDEFAGE